MEDGRPEHPLKSKSDFTEPTSANSPEPNLTVVPLK
jgi:hypothetical protein